jgi:hypothetical protein
VVVESTGNCTGLTVVLGAGSHAVRIAVAVVRRCALVEVAAVGAHAGRMASTLTVVLCFFSSQEA